MKESITLRRVIYPTNPDLSWSYSYTHSASVDERLKQTGIRIAAYLNAVFEVSR